MMMRSRTGGSNTRALVEELAQDFQHTAIGDLEMAKISEAIANDDYSGNRTKPITSTTTATNSTPSKRASGGRRQPLGPIIEVDGEGDTQDSDDGLLDESRTNAITHHHSQRVRSSRGRREHHHHHERHHERHHEHHHEHSSQSQQQPQHAKRQPNSEFVVDSRRVEEEHRGDVHRDFVSGGHARDGIRAVFEALQHGEVDATSSWIQQRRDLFRRMCDHFLSNPTQPYTLLQPQQQMAHPPTSSFQNHHHHHTNNNNNNNTHQFQHQHARASRPQSNDSIASTHQQRKQPEVNHHRSFHDPSPQQKQKQKQKQKDGFYDVDGPDHHSDPGGPHKGVGFTIDMGNDGMSETQRKLEAERRRVAHKQRLMAKKLRRRASQTVGTAENAHSNEDYTPDTRLLVAGDDELVDDPQLLQQQKQTQQQQQRRRRQRQRHQQHRSVSPSQTSSRTSSANKLRSRPNSNHSRPQSYRQQHQAKQGHHQPGYVGSRYNTTAPMADDGGYAYEDAYGDGDMYEGNDDNDNDGDSYVVEYSSHANHHRPSSSGRRRPNSNGSRRPASNTSSPHGDTASVVKGTKLRSNVTICKNAISSPACLGSGDINRDQREKTLAAMDRCAIKHLVIVLRSPNHLKYRGVYAVTAMDAITKIVGGGPKQITHDHVATYFRYDSGSKSFKPLPSKEFQVCDGVALKPDCWKLKSGAY